MQTPNAQQSNPTGADVKAEVQHRFGNAAANYAVSTVHVGGRDLDAMLAAARMPTGASARVLDVGTGAGHTAFAFAPHAASVEALDLTQQMLAEVERGARARGLHNIHCQLGDAEHLPYPDHHFDRITCRLCAHHFEHPRAFVREMARVLRPGGIFLLVDSSAPEDPALDTFFNAFELLRDPSHVRNHSQSQWRAMLAEVGLQAETLGSWMLQQDFEAWVRRIATPETAIAHLRTMFECASAEQRAAFEIETPSEREPDTKMSVGIPCSLIRASSPSK